MPSTCNACLRVGTPRNGMHARTYGNSYIVAGRAVGHFLWCSSLIVWGASWLQGACSTWAGSFAARQASICRLCCILALLLLGRLALQLAATSHEKNLPTPVSKEPPNLSEYQRTCTKRAYAATHKKSSKHRMSPDHTVDTRKPGAKHCAFKGLKKKAGIAQSHTVDAR